MADKPPVQKKAEAELNFDEAARRWHEAGEQVAHEKRMRLFRAGKLGAVETEQIIAEEVARGDARRRAEAERIEKEIRERGPRIRAGITGR